MSTALISAGLPLLTDTSARASLTATKIVFTTQPGDGDPNTALSHQPVVTLEDSSDHATTDQAAVTLTLNTVSLSGQAVPATLSCTNNPVTSNSSAVASFAGCKVSRGGKYTLTAAVTGLPSTTSSQFFISGPAQLAWNLEPGGGAANQTWAHQPHLVIEDANGTAVTTDTSQVGIAIHSGTAGAILSCTTNPLTPSTGDAFFSGCAIDKPGSNYKLYAVDKDDGLLSDDSTAFSITVGTVDHLVFTKEPTGAHGGQAFGTQPEITIEDSAGNKVLGNTDVISLAIKSNTGTSGATLSCTPATNSVTATDGVATFAGCNIDKVGSDYVLTATDSSASKSADSTPVSIAPGAATQIAFSTPQPSGGKGGSPFTHQPVVTLKDAGNNLVPGTVTLAIKSNTGTAGAKLSCAANPLLSTGTATFSNCSIDQTGDGYVLTATSGALSVDSDSFSISAGDATKVGFTHSPTEATGGVAFSEQPVVAVTDSGGNPASGSVTLSIRSGTGTPGATLQCDANPVTADAGVATFSGCDIDKVGPGYSLTASLDGVSGAVDNSPAFDVGLGSPTQLAFIQQPGGGTGGTAWSDQPIVAIEDAGGNRVSASQADIALSITSGTGNGALSCQDNTIPTVLGVARFANCSIDKTASAYTLTAQATIGGNTFTVTSDPFGVAVGDGAQLVFTNQPSGAAAGTSFPGQPEVTIEDRGGNVRTDDTSDISLSVTSGTGTSGAALSCSTESAVAGVADFNGCSIDQAGAGYTLTATDATDELSAESVPFSVLLAPPSPLEVAPTGVPLGQTFGGRIYANNPTSISDDVNTATGSLTLAASDLRVAGLGEPLAINRTYNSADTTGGVFGPGWSSPLDISVKVVSGQTATVRGEDGQQVAWTWNAVNNTWTAPPGAHGKLTCGSKQCRFIRTDNVQWDVNLPKGTGWGQIADYLAPDLQGLKFAWSATKVAITIGSTDTTHPTIVNATLSGGQVTKIATSTRSVSYGYSGGRLTSVTDTRNNTWTLGYTGGLLTQLTDPLGHDRMVASYDGAGRVQRLQLKGSPKHADDTFAWDGSTQTSTRSALSNVGGTLQRNDYIDRYSNNVLLSQTLPSGAIWRYSYDALTNLIEVQDPLGWVQQFTYDTNGNLTSQSTPINSTTASTVRMVYDSWHRVVSQTDANGNTSTYTYSGPYLSAIKPPATGNVQWTRFNYDGYGRLIQVISPRSQQILSYDKLGNQIKLLLQDLSGKTVNGPGVLTTWDEAGDKTSVTDPLVHKTTYVYDAAGNLLSTQPPAGPATSTAYNAAGDIASTTDAAGNTTSYAWDESNLTASITSGGATTTNTYDPSGNLLLESNSSHRNTTHVYDAADHEVSRTDASGITTQWTYDLLGGQIAMSSSAGQSGSRQYDSLHRAIRTVANGVATLTGYDPAGNVVSQTDGSGHLTTYAFNPDELMASVHTAAGTTSYTYDNAGNLITLTDPDGHPTTYTYSAAGNRLTRNVAGNVTNYGYDVASNLTSVTDPDGRKTAVTLDALGHPTTKTFTQTGKTTITVHQVFDALGRRTQLSDPTGTTNFTFDDAGDLTSATNGFGTFNYDYASQPGKILETYPDGTKVTYSLDDQHNLMQVHAEQSDGSDPVTASYLRNSLRQTTGIAFSNGVLETQQIDTHFNVVDQSLSVGGVPAADDSFSYDAGGDRIGQVDSVNGNITTDKFGYDAAGRMNAFSTSSTSGGIAWPTAPTTITPPTPNNNTPTTPPLQSFVPANPGPSDGGISSTINYDGNGNQLAADSGSTSYAYNNADGITTRTDGGGANAYTHDKSGNVTSIAGTTYSYDAAGHLVKVQTPSKTVTYTYDGDGNRVTKTVNGSTTQYLWDPAAGTPQLAIERTSGGNLIRRYIYGDGPVAMQTSTATYYYHLDPHGSVMELTDSNGGLAAAYHYDGFGKVTTEGTNPSDNPLLYQSAYLDSDTGLYYMRARNYDPASGRFTQRDLIERPTGFAYVSPYVFADDAPAVYSDPNGLETSLESIFWGHTTYEANAAQVTTDAVNAVAAAPKAIILARAFNQSVLQPIWNSLDSAATKAANFFKSSISSETTSAIEQLGEDTGSASAAASEEFAPELFSADGAAGEAGAAEADAGELLSVGGEYAGAIKTGGKVLGVLGVGLAVFITVEDCLHDTVSKCVGDAVGLGVTVAAIVACEVATVGVGSILCAAAGAALGFALQYVITNYGPQIAAGFVTAYQGTVQGAIWLYDTVSAGAQAAFGTVATGINTAISALSSGYQTAITTLVDAGYTALQLAGTLGNIFKEGINSAVSTLVDFGYQVGDIATALVSQFNAGIDVVATALKNTFNYTVSEVAGALNSAFALGEQTLAQAEQTLAQALKDVGYAVDEVGTALHSVYNAAAADVATALQAVNYGINQITDALQQVFDTADKDAAVILKGLGYAADEVAGALVTVFNDVDSAVATALDFATYVVNDIADALKQAFSDPAATVAAVLNGINKGVDAIAGAMDYAFSLADDETALILKNLSFTASEIAGALVSAYTDAAGEIADVFNEVGFAVNTVADVLKSSPFNELASDAASLLQTAGYTVTQVAGALYNEFAQSVAQITSILNGLNDSLTSIAGALHDAVGTAAKDIAAALSSVSSVVNDIAAAIGAALNLTPQGVAQALKDAVLSGVAVWTVTQIATVLKTLYSEIDSAAAAILSAIGFNATDIADVLASVYNLAANAIASILQGLGATATDIYNALKSAFSTITDATIGGILSAVGFADSAIQAIGGALASFGNTVSNAISDAWDAITSIF